MDPKVVAEIRAHDKRIAQVGNRKIGYCGHVPQNIYFEQPMIPTCIHAPKQNVEPRPATAYPSVESKRSQDDVLLDKLLIHPGGTTAFVQAADSKRIPGYAGHVPLSPRRAAADNRLGDSPTSVSQENSPSRSLRPRYPFARGPQRKAPIGYDVFLTN